MSILNHLENYFISHRHRLIFKTTKQPLRNFDLKKFEHISNFEGWGLTLVGNKNGSYVICNTEAYLNPVKHLWFRLLAKIVNRYMAVIGISMGFK